MTGKEVEIVRRCYESLARGDDAWLELVAPDFVVNFCGGVLIRSFCTASMTRCSPPLEPDA